MRKLILNACLLGAAAMLPSTSVLADDNGAEMVTVRVVDFSGRPPFKRELVEVPAVDVASMESMGQVVKMEKVWTVDFSGKPPFKRQFEEVPVIDIASMETHDAGVESKRSTRIPFKRHR